MTGIKYHVVIVKFHMALKERRWVKRLTFNMHNDAACVSYLRSPYATNAADEPYRQTTARPAIERQCLQTG